MTFAFHSLLIWRDDNTLMQMSQNVQKLKKIIWIFALKNCLVTILINDLIWRDDNTLMQISQNVQKLLKKNLNVRAKNLFFNEFIKRCLQLFEFSRLKYVFYVVWIFTPKINQLLLNLKKKCNRKKNIWIFAPKVDSLIFKQV